VNFIFYSRKNKVLFLKFGIYNSSQLSWPEQPLPEQSVFFALCSSITAQILPPGVGPRAFGLCGSGWVMKIGI
jgi:hypothetical protein